MFRKRRALTPRTPPTWDGRPESAIAYLHAEESWRKAAQLATWRENGVSEDEISRIAPQRLAELTAIYEARRSETRARLDGD